MIPQTRDTTPAEVYVYTTLRNYDVKQLYDFMHNGTMITTGSLIGFIFSSAAITLGVSSILLLSSQSEVRSRRYYFLCTYTVILLLLLVAAEVLGFISCNSATISFYWSLNKANEYGSKLGKLYYMMLVLVAVSTDGLLVWRCFLVHRALGRGSPKWCNLFWVFPACLWGTTIVAGSLAALLSDGLKLGTRLAVVVLASNVALNVHATLYITTRLLLHRRMVIACARDKKLVAQHTYIVGILLESAAINLPVTIVTAVGFGNQDTLYFIVLPVFAAGQALAAVLIIHQTALGRVFSQQKEAEISKLMEKRDGEHNTSGNGGSTV